MDIKTILKKIPIDASIFFTFITALYSVLMLIVNVGEVEVLMSAEDLLLIFVFSCLAAMAIAIKKLPKMPKPAGLFCHYFIFLIAFYLCFLLPRSMRPAQVFIGIIAFSLIYALIMALAALIFSRFRTNAEQEEEYMSRFKKSK